MVPTLVVGFYGANTWVPGQGEHWGFWVMLIALLIVSAGAVAVVLGWRRAEQVERERGVQERERIRAELLRSHT